MLRLSSVRQAAKTAGAVPKKRRKRKKTTKPVRTPAAIEGMRSARLLLPVKLE
jgi:hypothetical protein